MFGKTNNVNSHVDYTENEWTTSEYYCEVLEFLKERKIKNFIDIGACSGILGKLLFSKIDSLENCILVEAMESNFNFIKEDYKNNSKVKLYNNALYYGKEYVGIGEIGDSVGSFSILSNDNTKLIKTITLENILEESIDILNNDVDFIKIDIEGAEYNIIENSEVLKNIKYIEIEFHNNDEYGITSDKSRYEVWGPFLEKYLPNHQLVIGGDKEYNMGRFFGYHQAVYDGSGFFVLKDLL